MQGGIEMSFELVAVKHRKENGRDVSITFAADTSKMTAAEIEELKKPVEEGDESQQM